MYYSSGNYEAFAHPKKPEGVDHKSAYIIGTGLAALSAACYLVRDGQMKGERIHIFEKDPIPGGACDGFEYPGVGYVMRGGREMDNHFEVMWDLFHSIPSIETEGVSVLDEYYWLNKEDPNYSLCRATVNRGQDAHTDKKFAVSDKAQMEIMRLFFTPDEELYDKRIDEYFDDEVFDSNIKRDVDELINVVQKALDASEKVLKIKNMMGEAQYQDNDSQQMLQTYLDAAQKEADYADDNLQKTYEQYIGRFDKYLESTNIAITNAGSLKNSLNLTMTRVENQQMTIEELKSDNEDRDISDIIIDYYASYNAYQSSLTAAGKLGQSSLLDYI